MDMFIFNLRTVRFEVCKLPVSRFWQHHSQEGGKGRRPAAVAAAGRPRRERRPGSQQTQS